jgi:excinuclease ABC subunit C
MAGELLRIPGIGPKLARTLWDHFGSIAAMANADTAALAAIPGIGPRLAAKLADSLRSLNVSS